MSLCARDAYNVVVATEVAVGVWTDAWVFLLALMLCYFAVLFARVQLAKAR